MLSGIGWTDSERHADVETSKINKVNVTGAELRNDGWNREPRPEAKPDAPAQSTFES
jgi:hypothetical protein